MIISASRRTDIPAFYAEWFMNRVRAGYFVRVNPFNTRQRAAFSLDPADVDAICFWTKNPRPLMRHLDELDHRGFRYYFQFTLNPYGPPLEQNLPPVEERIATFGELAERIGSSRMIWRYDPIILSTDTPVRWHLQQAEHLASRLEGAATRLVISFCDLTPGTLKRVRGAMGRGTGIREITAPELHAEMELLATGFATAAGRHGFRVHSCSEAADLSRWGIEHGACVDGALIRELFGTLSIHPRDRQQRRWCRCVESVDMGMYNSCMHGCIYCYATFSERLLELSRRGHDPESPVLIGSCRESLPIRSTRTPERTKKIPRQPIVPPPHFSIDSGNIPLLYDTDDLGL